MPAYCKDDDPHMTGLPEITQSELEWQNKHMIRVNKVNLNRIGFERINNWRVQKGLMPLREEDAEVVEKGKEVTGIVGELAPEAISGSEPPQADLPPYIDNSILKYFPPIRSQGSLPSCGVFSGTYYAMTYMYAFIRDLDAKNGVNSLVFSPKWTYNMVNGGELSGSWYYWAYEIGQKHGCATWAEFPYVGSTSNPLYYREWCLDSTVWRAAIDRRFDQYGYVYNTHLDSGIEQVKQLLVDGYVLNIPTYINSWQWRKIGDDSATADDDAFVGKDCVYWVNGTQGYHAMTVVGYSDDIWVDINGNGSLDSGEKGAFRIANSWGTGWGENGFCWMSYDALRNPSAVANGPSTDRIYGWSPSRAHWVTARASYQPTMVAEFTLNHLMRNQMGITLGVSDTIQTLPDTTWYPEMIYFQGGPYGFDGSTIAVDGTFVLDFSDIAPSGGTEKRYYLAMYDSMLGDSALLLSYKLIDVLHGNIITECYDIPQEADAGQVYAYIDYYYDDGNIKPVADMAGTSPISGQASLEVYFIGTDSFDPDGMIMSYDWNFGDGYTGSGMTITHTYNSAGTYIAQLTVTDDKGATDSDTVEISVTPAPPKAMYVNSIDMSLSIKGVNAEAKALVTIIDEDRGYVTNALVSGRWSDLVNTEVSGLTGVDGTVTFTAKSKSSGTFVFTVNDVSASGYVYDPELNEETEDSIATDSQTNQNPIADAGNDQRVNPGDIVTFDGSHSYDPDGTIVSYEWDFGDGSIGDSITTTHRYISSGWFTAQLTVTDDDGATGSDTVLIEVTDGSEKELYVYTINMSISHSGLNAQAHAEVVIFGVLEGGDGPVANAIVTGKWSGLTDGSVTGVTGSDGTVIFTSSKSKKSGDFTFTVTDVTADMYIYNAALNNETTDFITNP